jgi:hypothetical protein
MSKKIEKEMKEERIVHPAVLFFPSNEEEPISHISVAVKCPDCGNVHIHGWGTGWRQPDCSGSSYYLVCDDDNFSAAIQIRKPMDAEALLRLIGG